MSIDYANALAPYDNKGEVGQPEFFDSDEELDRKSDELANLLKKSRCCIVYTGAGVSTAAGIADFRGPQGRASNSVDFVHAKPTFTHKALRELEKEGIVKFVVTQNVDGLHPRSGFPLNRLAELHGNVFCEQCDRCSRRYYRSFGVGTIGLKETGRDCEGTRTGRACRGRLRDTTLDWEDALPEEQFELARRFAQASDLALCLGTSLQIVPVGNMPLITRRKGGKLVTVNLQHTKHEKKADLVIHGRVDYVMRRVMMTLGFEVADDEESDIQETSKHPLEEFALQKKTRKRKTSSLPVPTVIDKEPEELRKCREKRLYSVHERDRNRSTD